MIDDVELIDVLLTLSLLPSSFLSIDGVFFFFFFFFFLLLLLEASRAPRERCDPGRYLVSLPWVSPLCEHVWGGPEGQTLLL